MTLLELSDMTGADLILTYRSGRGTEWICSLRRAQVKEYSQDTFITETCGIGTTPEAAMADYANKLKNRWRWLVIDAEIGERRDFSVPDSLTA